MTESPKPSQAPADVSDQVVSAGPVWILIISIGLCLLSAMILWNAMNWTGAENYASLLYYLVGMPILLVQLFLAPFLYSGFRSQSRAAALSALIPGSICAAMSAIYFIFER